MAEMTPMKAQYAAIKKQYDDCLLFFRLGDFYEMFDEDARVASRELDLTLTTRDRNKPEAEQTPMCGVPYHSAEVYISRLISKGYKVAVCEQREDPQEAKGLVRRDVIRVITPGTVLESSMLEENMSNYLAAAHLNGAGGGGIAFCDISTGEICVASFAEDASQHLQNELSRFRPRETVLSKAAAADVQLCALLERRLDCRRELRDEWFTAEIGAERLCAQYEVDSPSALGLGEDEYVLCALGGLLSYLAETQRGDMRQLRRPEIFTRGRYMELDNAALRGLELTQNLRTGEKKGSLLWVLDKTKTPMGGRLMRSWVERPLLSPVAIQRRLAAVNELYQDTVGRGELIRNLRDIGDIQRLLSRAVYGTANGQDMLALGHYLEKLPILFRALSDSRSALLRAVAETDPLEELGQDLRRLISEKTPITVREGGIFNRGCFPEV
ncbi:MAG: DNA mismatch repair protein MutS, partial [Eubacteriales bacterium]|nr:DNA mismatch repair protein MutS [Eubacteriales bacterium]